jgi:hypothetical protein
MVADVLLHLVEVAEGPVAALEQRLLPGDLISSTVAGRCSVSGIFADGLPICDVGVPVAGQRPKAARRAQQLWRLINLQSKTRLQQMSVIVVCHNYNC